MTEATQPRRPAPVEPAHGEATWISITPGERQAHDADGDRVPHRAVDRHLGVPGARDVPVHPAARMAVLHRHGAAGAVDGATRRAARSRDRDRHDRRPHPAGGDHGAVRRRLRVPAVRARHLAAQRADLGRHLGQRARSTPRSTSTTSRRRSRSPRTRSGSGSVSTAAACSGIFGSVFAGDLRHPDDPGLRLLLLGRQPAAAPDHRLVAAAGLPALLRHGLGDLGREDRRLRRQQGRARGAVGVLPRGVLRHHRRALLAAAGRARRHRRAVHPDGRHLHRRGPAGPVHPGLRQAASTPCGSRSSPRSTSRSRTTSSPRASAAAPWTSIQRWRWAR